MTSSTVASHRRWLELQLDLPTIRVWLPVAACVCIVALAAFSAPVDIGEGRSIGPIYQPLKGPSIVLKLTTAGAAGLVGLWGVFCLPRVRQLQLSLPGVLLWSVACLFFLTTPTAVTNSALAIALVFVCYLLFVPTCLVVLQVPGLMKAMFFGILAYTSVSLLMYLFLPNYGVYLEELGEGILSARLGGMSQPNQTGRMASIGLLLSTVFFRQMPCQRWF